MFLDHDSERSHRRKRGEKEERHEEASKREKSILKYVTLKRKEGGKEEDEKFSFERKEGINPSPLCLFYAWRRNIRENRGTRWKNEAEIWRIFDEKGLRKRSDRSSLSYLFKEFTFVPESLPSPLFFFPK